MSDTALRTADAGYLTRRLVDVAQDVVVNSEDCGTKEYDVITAEESKLMNQTLDQRIFGRIAAADIVTADGRVLVAKNNGIDEQMAKQIVAEGLDNIRCRSVLKCKLTRGICRLCYGYDLGFNKMVDLGAAVGIVAAQAIGEPGTQLTMRTFHTGGVASVKDITQGLPRVEELFEAREPKGLATVAEIAGTVTVVSTSSKEQVLRIEGQDVKREVFALPAGGEALIKDGAHVGVGDALMTETDGKLVKATNAGIVKVTKDGITLVHESDDVREYVVPAGFSLLVKDGELVTPGQPLTEGNLNPAQVMALQGTESAQKYIVKEVQDIYVSQGQQIHDKHVEVIVRQMFSKMRMTVPGDTSFIAGDMVDKAKLQDINEKLLEEGRTPAEADQLLMGITKISLNTESFLAAASFQETTRVLIEASLTGKTDYLRGLKENVIIGKLIPAGTGFREVQIDEIDTSVVLDEA
jgi:DNA-directed RNA polymerase subunit beta'